MIRAMALRKPITTTIAIHPLAPAQPRTGEPCNGCGVCCLAFPCPLGRVLSLRRMGRCSALRWSDADRRYLSEGSMALLYPTPPITLPTRTEEVIATPELATA